KPVQPLRQRVGRLGGANLAQGHDGVGELVLVDRRLNGRSSRRYRSQFPEEYLDVFVSLPIHFAKETSSHRTLSGILGQRPFPNSGRRLVTGGRPRENGKK